MRKGIIILLLCIGITWGISCSIKQPYSIIVDEDAINGIQFSDFTLTLDLVLGKGKEENNKFESPNSIAIDKKGNMYILDIRKNGLKLFSNEGEYIKTVGRGGTGNGEFYAPRDILIDDRSNLYITDCLNKRIQLLSKEGKFLNSFKLPFYPDQIVINENLIYVSPAGEGKFPLYKYSKEGKFISWLGIKPKGNKNLHNKVNLFVDPWGDIYLAHRFLPIVQKYSPDGKLITQFAYTPSIKNRQPPQIIGTIRRQARGSKASVTKTMKDFPICYDIAVDSSGTINLLVAVDHRKDELSTLYRFDPSGNLLEKVDLPLLCGKMHVDASNNFYFISPTVTNMVFRYKYLQN